MEPDPAIGQLVALREIVQYVSELDEKPDTVYVVGHGSDQGHGRTFAPAGTEVGFYALEFQAVPAVIGMAAIAASVGPADIPVEMANYSLAPLADELAAMFLQSETSATKHGVYFVTKRVDLCSDPEACARDRETTGVHAPACTGLLNLIDASKIWLVSCRTPRGTPRQSRTFAVELGGDGAAFVNELARLRLTPGTAGEYHSALLDKFLDLSPPTQAIVLGRPDVAAFVRAQAQSRQQLDVTAAARAGFQPMVGLTRESVEQFRLWALRTAPHRAAEVHALCAIGLSMVNLKLFGSVRGARHEADPHGALMVVQHRSRDVTSVDLSEVEANLTHMCTALELRGLADDLVAWGQLRRQPDHPVHAMLRQLRVTTPDQVSELVATRLLEFFARRAVDHLKNAVNALGAQLG